MSKGFNFIIPKQLSVEVIEQSKGVEFINIDLALFLINQIFNGNKENEYKRLCSDILKTLNTQKYKYTEHINWMKNKGFIKIKNHRNFSESKSRCKGFKISDKYQTSCNYEEEKEYIEYNCEDSKYIEIFNKQIRKRKIEAQSSTQHLTKWLDSPEFTIDTEQAFNFVSANYKGVKFNNKREKRERDIRNFKANKSIYSRDGKDNRLHNCFVKIAGDLKQFIMYEGQYLKECDIKNAQPFIFSIFLEKMLKEYKRNRDNIPFFKQNIKYEINKSINNEKKGYYKQELYRINIKEMINKSIMLIKTFRPTDFEEVYTFINLVRNGDIYEKVGEELFEKGTIWESNDLFWVKLPKELESKTIQVDKDFSSLRKCAKSIVLNALYSNPKSNGIKAINDFRSIFPIISKILEALKIDNYKDLPILMQRMESKCILDYCTKKINKKYPNMLLISRHDSLSTTIDNISILEAEFKSELTNYFNVEVIYIFCFS